MDRAVSGNLYRKALSDLYLRKEKIHIFIFLYDFLIFVVFYKIFSLKLCIAYKDTMRFSLT